MQVKKLGQLVTPFGQGLRALALTCDDFRSLWSRSILHASQSKFFTVWPPNQQGRLLSDWLICFPSTQTLLEHALLKTLKTKMASERAISC